MPTRTPRAELRSGTAGLPIVARFPALAEVPRVALGSYPTPVVAASAIAPQLWVKRDDLCANPVGGNKARALEFLLGGIVRGDSVVTVGSAGSTHALTVATYAKQLGVRTFVGRWRQEMNDTAHVVAERTGALAEAAPIFRTPVEAYVWAATKRLRGARWIAAGGSTPLGILGHVNAGLELVDQIDAGALPMPKYVVVPLGTGGTVAGIALAFSIAARPVTVIGARVVPKIVARAARVRRLADATARLIEGKTGSKVPRIEASRVVIAHETYGGAYGRETDAGRAAAERMQLIAGVRLDPTYSAKALTRAIALAADAPTVFWLTFDSRVVTNNR
ncbi:MAG TPA: pyridoxal-phosphate dependent enzyme [Gemmatimonadaceae bacterium]